MNGRVYDPVLGRFLSPDPVVSDATYSHSWNALSYALKQPPELHRFRAGISCDRAAGAWAGARPASA